MAEVRDAKEFVFGVHDGALVTVGILSGMTGAGMPSAVLTLVGAIHVFAGSIGVGLVTFTSSQSHAAYRQGVYEFERAEIQEHPAREKERVHEALAKKGLRGKALSVATEEITEEKDHWARFFIEERFGSAHEHPRSAFMSAFIIALSYACAALVALLPLFFISQPYAMSASIVLALGIVCFAGVSKTRFTHRNPIMSGLEGATTTAIVALVSFVAGSVLASVL